MPPGSSDRCALKPQAPPKAPLSSSSSKGHSLGWSSVDWSLVNDDEVSPPFVPTWLSSWTGRSTAPALSGERVTVGRTKSMIGASRLV